MLRRVQTILKRDTLLAYETQDNDVLRLSETL